MASAQTLALSPRKRTARNAGPQPQERGAGWEGDRRNARAWLTGTSDSSPGGGGAGRDGTGAAEVKGSKRVRQEEGGLGRDQGRNPGWFASGWAAGGLGCRRSQGTWAAQRAGGGTYLRKTRISWYRER